MEISCIKMDGDYRMIEHEAALSLDDTGIKWRKALISIH